MIAGHSHQPLIEERDGVLLVNPGSAGPRRFRLPVAVARLLDRQGTVRGEIVVLERVTGARTGRLPCETRRYEIERSEWTGVLIRLQPVAPRRDTRPVVKVPDLFTSEITGSGA